MDPEQCTGAILAYRDNQLIFKREPVGSGDVTFGDLFSGDGPIVVSLFTGSGVPSSSVTVVILLPAGLVVEQDFGDDPRDELGEPQELSEEIVQPDCFVQGAGEATRTDSEGSAHKARALVEESNAKGLPGIGDHVSVHQRVARSPLAGPYYLGIWGKIDGATASMANVWLEYAIAQTSLAGSGWATREAAIQLLSDCTWAVWTDYSSGRPHWEVFARSCPEADTFHHLALTFDWDTRFYRNFTINESLVFDLSRYRLPVLPNKFHEWATVWSAEAEAGVTCGTTAIARYRAVYDYLEIRPLTAEPAAFTALSAATYTLGKPLAPGMIVAGFGTALAAATESAETVPLPTELSGVQVVTTDADLKSSLAPLFYVAESQINLQVPEGTRPGRMEFAILRGGETVASGVAAVAADAPGIFTADSKPNGALAGSATLRRKDGTTVTIPAFVCTDTLCSSNPIVRAPDVEKIVITLYATGLSAAAKTKPADVTAWIGEKPAPLVFFGEAAGLVGVQQANVEVPEGIVGDVGIMLRTRYSTSNTPTISLR